MINRQALYHDSGDAGLTQLLPDARDAQLWRHIEFHPECNAIYAHWTGKTGSQAMPPCKGDENMYCTVKEIIREVLNTDVPASECVFAVVLTRGDVRHIAQDWSLTDDELEASRSAATGRCLLRMVRMSALFTTLFVS